MIICHSLQALSELLLKPLRGKELIVFSAERPKLSSSNATYDLFVETASTMSETDLDTCFRLVELTSSEDYKKSKGGWKPKSKLKEMKLLDLKYILVKAPGSDEVLGFVSFMPTYEDDHAVIYCYEIHLQPALQGYPALIVPSFI